MLILLFYILSVLLLYSIIFYRLFKKIKSKSFIILQNNYELRGGGGLITQTFELFTFFGIPYKIKKHTFSDLNTYKEKSFSPFYELLAKNMYFRDLNYSIFQENNIKRFNDFYEKIFINQKIPDNWIIINFSFFEKIISFFPFLKIGNFKIKKVNIFRNLSHLTTDNPIGPEKRKFILFSLALKMLFYILFIPFLIHIILIKLFFAKINKNFYIISNNFKDISINSPFISIEENNLIGRKNNRFIQNFIEYNFYITNKDKGYISGIGKIKIHKTLLAGESFPISGKYTSVIRPIFSKHFNFADSNYKKILLINGSSTNTIFDFSFKIKKSGFFKIINQSGIKNNIININLQTRDFKYFPKTNLKSKIDHLNSDTFIDIKKDIKIKYEILDDTSLLKLQSRFISKEGKIQLNFQKEITNISINESFIFYNGKKIKINKIEHSKGDKTCLFIYYEKSFIPSYKFNKDTSAYIKIYKIKDSSNITHYKDGKIITLPWK